jgi:hypothetical protein
MTWPNENKIPEYIDLPEDHPLVVKVRKIDALIKELDLDFQFNKGEVGDNEIGFYALMRSSYKDNNIRCYLPNPEYSKVKNEWYLAEDIKREVKAKEYREQKIQKEKDRIAEIEQNEINREKRLLEELKAKYES